MRRVAALLTFAAAATATYYVDERFEGTQFPPAGWEESNVNGDWSRSNFGPPRNWAATGTISYGSGGVYCSAALKTYLVYVVADTPLHYHYYFEYSSNHVDNNYAAFQIFYDGATTPFVNDQVPSWPLWAERSDSVVAPQTGYIYVRLYNYGRTNDPSGGGAKFDVDDVQLSDENITALAPVSFGRVKALFR